MCLDGRTRFFTRMCVHENFCIHIGVITCILCCEAHWGATNQGECEGSKDPDGPYHFKTIRSCRGPKIKRLYINNLHPRGSVLANRSNPWDPMTFKGLCVCGLLGFVIKWDPLGAMNCKTHAQSVYWIIWACI